jgi:hypothetical protein
MLRFKNPPGEDSPANDGNRYGALVAAVTLAAQGAEREVPGLIADGLDSFRETASALLEIRRGNEKTSWRSGFDLAVGSFLAAPSSVQAARSLDHIPDRPDPDCWPFEAATLMVTRATLAVAAGEFTRAWNAAHLAQESAAQWLARFGDHKVEWDLRNIWERAPKVEAVTSIHNWQNKQAKRLGYLLGDVSITALNNYAVAPVWTAAQKPYAPSALLLEASCREVASVLRAKGTFDLT